MGFIEAKTYKACRELQSDAVPVLLLKCAPDLDKENYPNRLICYTDEKGPGIKSKITFDPKEYKIHIIPFKIAKQRSCVCIFGQSGSGKSQACGNLLNMALKYDRYQPVPKFENVLVTASKSPDEAFDRVVSGMTEEKAEQYKVLTLNIDRAMNGGNFNFDSLRNLNFIFDDFGNNFGKGVDEFIQLLMLALLERSRKLNTDIYVIVHQARDFNKTRALLLESNAFMTFPQTNRNAMLKMMRDYCDFDKAQLNTIKDLDSAGRFTCMYYNRSPSYMISNDRIISM
jgi:hypothetical protein